VTGQVEPGQVGPPVCQLGPGDWSVLRSCRAVSLSDNELEGLEKVKDMEEWGVDDLVGLTLIILMCSVCADTD
jgi:hypothetical protein